MAPFLVPVESADSIRYVYPPGTERVSSTPTVLIRPLVFAAGWCAWVMGLTVYWLSQNANALDRSAWLLSWVFLGQLVLDGFAVARSGHRMLSCLLGRPEIELRDDRLRRGRRWLGFWVASESRSVSAISRLVIVRRPEPSAQQNEMTWELVAESLDEKPLTLLSVYEESETVMAVGRHLHASLARSRGTNWPPLATEDWPPRESVPIAKTFLLPGGPPTWLVIHVVGSVGLWYLVGLARRTPLPGPWQTIALGSLVLFQSLALGLNLVALGFARRQADR